jgi:hypothetical protein
LNNASTLVSVPTKSNLVQIAKRIQKKINKEPPIPRTLSEVEIPDEYKNYENG